MTRWLQDIVEFVGMPNAVEERRHFEVDGCTIDLRTLPCPSVIFSVPHLQGRTSPIRSLIGERERCDLVVLAIDDTNPIVLFVEAKSGRDRDYKDSEKAVSQLKSS